MLKPQGLQLHICHTLQPTVLPTPARVLESEDRRPQPEADGGTRKDHPSLRGPLPSLVPCIRQRHRSTEVGERNGVQ